MEYSGKLYGKVDDSYFPLHETTEDYEALQKKVAELESKIKKTTKTLLEIAGWDDDLEDRWGDPGELAANCLKNL